MRRTFVVSAHPRETTLSSATGAFALVRYAALPIVIGAVSRNVQFGFSR